MTNKNLLLFLLKAGLIYLAWEVLYQAVIVPHTLLDEAFIHMQTLAAAWILDLLGFDLFTASYYHGRLQDLIWINGSVHSLWVMQGCDAVDLLALCAVFILAFPSVIKQKAWLFAYLGAITVCNILRICALVLLEYSHPLYLEFNHKYTFSALMYMLILYFWYRWLRPYRELKRSKNGIIQMV